MGRKKATGPSPLVLGWINQIRAVLPAMDREDIADRTGLEKGEVDRALSEWKKWERVIGDSVHFARPGPLKEASPPKYVLAGANQKFDEESTYSARTGRTARLLASATSLKRLAMLISIGKEQATSATERAHWDALGGTVQGASIHVGAIVDLEKARAKKKK